MFAYDFSYDSLFKSMWMFGLVPVGSCCRLSKAEESVRWLVHLPSLLQLYQVKFLAIRESFSLKPRNKRCCSLQCLHISWLTSSSSSDLKEKMPTLILGWSAHNNSFSQMIFIFLFSYLNSHIFYTNYNLLRAEAMFHVATVVAQKAKKDLECYLLSE